MKRRAFLKNSAGTLAGWMALDRSVPGWAEESASPKRSRIGVSTWSFHNLFETTYYDHEAPRPARWLDVLEFPQMVADRYDVHQFEFVAPHFASTSAAYIRDLNARLVRARSRLVNIPVDIHELEQGGGLSDADPAVRDRAVAACLKWIDIARDLGARSVRCDPGKVNPADLAPTISAYKELATYGRSKGVRVLIENHGGIGSEHPETLVQIFREVGEFAGALPDFGNFPDETTRHRGLPLLFPYAGTVCHAKGFRFDAQGNETRFDFARCMEAAKQAGFRGVYSIEFSGPGDPYEGVQRVVDELLRFL